jgi:uncharacterized repeat protein (TIGR03803 family)
MTAPTVGILLLSLVAQARSQEEKAPKPPTYTVLYTFNGGADGAIPAGGDLILDPEGNLYGTTGWGGDLSCFRDNPPGCGVVFKVDKEGQQTVLHSFTGGADGILSFSGVVRDHAGNLYGNTCYGGSGGAGVVFKLELAGNETILYNFTGGADGGCPGYGMLRDDAGNLYATAGSGGDLSGCFGGGCGVVFKLDTAGNETVLYSFTGGLDGGYPNDLVRDAEGTLYGTTISGGDLSGCNGQGCGVVFKVDRVGKETVLYSFTGGADGATPFAGVVQDDAGNLYGTTFGGGSDGSGVVFKLDRTGKETVLYNFSGGADGGFPAADLVRDDEGNLYSTTTGGGDVGCFGGGNQCGVVFMLDRNRKETVLYSFTGGADGGYNFDGLVRDAEGNLYGATGYGGDLKCNSTGYGCGVVYKITPHDDCKDSEKKGEILPSQSD